MKTVLVIAGNNNEYQEYIRTRINHEQTYYYVRDSYMLRGLTNPDGVFIGSWYHRPDIKELLELLYTRMTDSRKQIAIRDIIRSLPAGDRPDITQSIYDNVLNKAASNMAEHIDQELLNSFK
jgi:hypothetical protein